MRKSIRKTCRTKLQSIMSKNTISLKIVKAANSIPKHNYHKYLTNMFTHRNQK